MESTRIGILVVAYNAQATLASVLDRIPADFRQRITAVLVSDDHSGDATFQVGVDYLTNADIPIEVAYQPRNLGYGGNQKVGYHWAIAHNLDVVVMLHADGQYAPEFLPNMVDPIVNGNADAVFGSRMATAGAARKGGMPLYKYLGNKLLTEVQNRLTGASLTEWHSGYRAYRVKALRDIPFEKNDQGFRFDTQIILQLIEAEKKITEIPIPTFYGDEVCYVNGLGYARDIIADVLRYRAHRIGLGSGDLAFRSKLERPSGGPETTLLDELAASRPLRILNLSTEFGSLSLPLIRAGHDVIDLPQLLNRDFQSTFSEIDVMLDDQIDLFEVATSHEYSSFDVILALDVFARVRDPERLLRALHPILRPSGTLFTSVANIEHWYPRMRISAGFFDYDQRGSLDTTHLRLFSRRSMNRLAVRSGWTITTSTSFGLPFDLFTKRSPAKGSGRTVPKWVQKIDRFLSKHWPSMFSYSFLYGLKPAAPRSASMASTSNPEPSTVEMNVPFKVSNRESTLSVL